MMDGKTEYYYDMSETDRWMYLGKTAEKLTESFKSRDYKFSVSQIPDTLDVSIPKISSESGIYTKAVMGMVVMAWFGENIGFVPNFNITIK